MGSQTPPWSLQVRCPVPWDPPEPSQSRLWTSQGPPRTPPRAPKTPQGDLESARLTIQNLVNMCVLPSRISKNSFFLIFGPLVELLGRTLACAFALQTLPMVSKSRPEPSQGLPRTPLEHPCEFQVGNCFIENRRLQHFTQIMHHFHQFSTTIFGLQIGPCQLLHIFGCDFQFSGKSSHLGSFPRTPSGIFLDPLAHYGLRSNNKL